MNKKVSSRRRRSVLREGRRASQVSVWGLILLNIFINDDPIKNKHVLMEFTGGIREGGTVTAEMNKTLIYAELSDLEEQDRINWMK